MASDTNLKQQRAAWSLYGALLLGALIGGMYGLTRVLYETSNLSLDGQVSLDSVPSIAGIIGGIVGSAVGGSICFVVLAAVRNMFVK